MMQAVGQRVYAYLGANQLVDNRQLPWQADLITINNPTDQTVYIRLGANDTPTAKNYDDLVPPFFYRQIRVHTAFLNVALSGVPTEFATGLAPSAGRVILTYSVGEDSTPGSSYPLANLSLATSVVGTGISGTLGPFDLSAWGGIILVGSPNSSTPDQHGYATYQASDDSTSWYTITRLPLWPGVTLQAQLPRVSRYGRILWQPYGAPLWSATATYTLRARPTQAEILNVVPTLTGPPVRNAWSTGSAFNIYLPGDLVAAIDWQVDNSAVGSTAQITAEGALDTSVTKTQLNLVLVNPFPGLDAAHGTFAEPYPVVHMTLSWVSGTSPAAGIWSAIPLIRTGPPDVMGQPSDDATTPTLPGLLKAINNNAFNTYIEALAVAGNTTNEHADLTAIINNTALAQATYGSFQGIANAGVYTRFAGQGPPSNSKVLGYIISPTWGGGGALCVVNFGNAATAAGEFCRFYPLAGGSPSGWVSSGGNYLANGANPDIWIYNGSGANAIASGMYWYR